MDQHASTYPAAPESLPDLTGAHYLDVLRSLHTILQPRNYLEIGTYDGQSLALSDCPSIAVDPGFPITDPGIVARIVGKPQLHLFRMASDRFFQRHDPASLFGEPVQLAFLDGMHRASSCCATSSIPSGIARPTPSSPCTTACRSRSP